MIKIERYSPPINSIMDKKKDEVLKGIKQSIAKGKKPQIKPLWSSDNKVKDFLHKSQYGKCCYCERKRSKIEVDIEHFRPKAKVKERPEHPGYWWLAYDWNNLLISCKTCNQQYKRVQFPIKNESERAFNKNDDLEKEAPFLINPLKENPENFIEYDIPNNNTKSFMLKAIGKCERGDKTVKLTGINDTELLLERADRFNLWRQIFASQKGSTIRKNIKEYMEPSNIFAGLARFYLTKVLNLNDS